jgi:hypothetical protein
MINYKRHSVHFRKYQPRPNRKRGEYKTSTLVRRRSYVDNSASEHAGEEGEGR